jgi:hypothetical protein
MAVLQLPLPIAMYFRAALTFVSIHAMFSPSGLVESFRAQFLPDLIEFFFGEIESFTLDELNTFLFALHRADFVFEILVTLDFFQKRFGRFD